MNFPGKVRQSLELALTRLGVAVIPALPRRAVVHLAGFFGGLAWLFSRHLRRTGRANLDIAFGDSLAAVRKQQILRQSFSSFALVMLDMFWFSRDPENRIRKYVRFDESYEMLKRKEPKICLTAHLGNWELLGKAASFYGAPMVSVAAPLANPALDSLFNSMRGNTGQTVVSKGGAIRKLMQTLRDGGNIAVLLDQNTKPARGGIFVDYFGLPVPVSSAAATLYLHTKARILFSCCLPEPGGYYRTLPILEITPPDTTGMEKDEAVLTITQAVAKATEQAVREYPGNWLWMYKRWKYHAPGADASRYPFYSKELLPEDRRDVSAEEKEQ
ncbi:MAG: lysophospholipid acyltransferase family protein [Kiritimatiellia bacterium]